MIKPLDCLVIGPGPAGLTAAIYLARFHLSIAVVDAGNSRAAQIPRTLNHAGYPGGIPGRDLLKLMREQAESFAVHVEMELIERLERTQEGFIAHGENRAWSTRTILLSTGVVNNRPQMAPDVHDAALQRGLLRYCPICDGYEVTDKRVGVLGTRSHGFKEAIFLRMYTRDVTLIATDGEHDLSDEERRQLRAAEVMLVDGPCAPLRMENEQMLVATPLGELRFDSVYPALGSVIRSELATAIGADGTDDGCLAYTSDAFNCSGSDPA
ncbi:NAD(P)/FAD-dependent oxidoreductase [Novosphingobium sp. ST904]|uniref:NAD(P)/FAD-dependent oxidoreductase n=1 Tax=Novosphingobium sp. ST904 TaxID=1684385 RepID=UPI0009E952DB|nr:NAD(P)/FAD-dependent oxidoreductase [Novosphingobium sp. ST904]TCM25379.1 thioredoxin reductase (NADPH) [Novosphingobium sp. ST904]